MADHINSFMDKIEDNNKIKKINLNALKLLARYGDVYKPVVDDDSDFVQRRNHRHSG
jgi:hypothetical protein